MSSRTAQKIPPKGSQSRPKAGPERPRLKVTLTLPPVSTSVLRLKSKPRPGEGTPAHQLPAFKRAVGGWAFCKLSNAAREIRSERGHVLSQHASGPELCFDLVIPNKLRPQLEALLTGGRVTLGPGPWPHETLALWKDEHPRCVTRVINLPHNMTHKNLLEGLTTAGYRVESVHSEGDPDVKEFCRASAAIVTFAASAIEPPLSMTVSAPSGEVTCDIRFDKLHTDRPRYTEGVPALAPSSYAAAAAGGGGLVPAPAADAAAAEGAEAEAACEAAAAAAAEAGVAAAAEAAAAAAAEAAAAEAEAEAAAADAAAAAAAEAAVAEAEAEADAAAAAAEDAAAAAAAVAATEAEAEAEAEAATPEAESPAASASQTTPTPKPKGKGKGKGKVAAAATPDPMVLESADSQGLEPSEGVLTRGRAAASGDHSGKRAKRGDAGFMGSGSMEVETPVASISSDIRMADGATDAAADADNTPTTIPADPAVSAPPGAGPGPDDVHA